jgi:hypothetical protein
MIPAQRFTTVMLADRNREQRVMMLAALDVVTMAPKACLAAVEGTAAPASVFNPMVYR